jgi:hypothetical protein
VLRALAQRVSVSSREIEQGALAAEFAAEDPRSCVHRPSTPLTGYRTVELTVGPRSPALGHRLAEVQWPAGCIAVALTQGREIVTPREDTRIREGAPIMLLAPAPSSAAGKPNATAVSN